MIFRRAVRRLTLAYAGVQLGVYAVVALAVYLFVTATFDFDPENGGISAEQGFALLGGALLAGGVALVIVAPLAGWFMARAALAPIRRTYELQQRFVDGAAHELRTPLALIQGELELALSRSRTPAQYRAAIEVAASATATVVRLSDDLLLLARGDSDDLAASFEPLDLDALAASALDGTTGTPTLRLAATSAATVIGSRELLVRALGNLVDNARKFTPPDGRVTVSTSLVGPYAVIEVRDTGRGMSPDDLRRARDRFWRADTARSSEGTGLGLALVESIARAHHGELLLDSRPGDGVTATLRLPAAAGSRA
ncbi:MAG: HAMP domain-containing histidine kinase [Actinomycetales bacterium]|nr:HAMP domain-containing histidine kinase [Actinomycetales bacterium]